MSLPVNTASILEYLGYKNQEDFSVTISAENVVILTWMSATEQPTDQEIIDTGNSPEYNRSVKNAELKAQRSIYSANQIASDPQSGEVVRQENDWLEGQTIELLKLTDVPAIKDFDTAKPEVLELANNVLGARYLDQGLKLQAENDASTSAGVPNKWDQTALSTFVANNKQAADDITGSTPPNNPDYLLRQGTVTPADRTSELLVYRSTRQYEGRPSPDPSLEMVITDKQNGRPLYAFLYVKGGSFLEWIQFVDFGDGTWRANSSVNILAWVEGDLDIVLSYSTNPAVQQDWFTDKFPFDAGGDQIVLRIRWDAAAIETRGRSTGGGNVPPGRGRN